MTRRHAGEDSTLVPHQRTAWRRVTRQPRVHYGYLSAVGALVAFCQTRTGAVMYGPKLQSDSSKVDCKLCLHHLGRQGAPSP